MSKRLLTFDLASIYAATARQALASAERSETALTRISGLLQERRWWNDNVWAAEQVANDALAARAENGQAVSE